MRKLLLLSGAIMLLSFTNLRSQDDANCRVVIDGMMVDTIDCWGFKNAGVVFPVDIEKWKKYDAVAIKVSYRVSGPDGGTYEGGAENLNGQLRMYSRVLSFYFEKKNIEDWFANASLGYWMLDLDGKKTTEIASDQFSDFGGWYQVSEKKWATEDWYIQYEVVGHFKGTRIMTTDSYGNIFKASLYDDGTILYQSKEYHVKSYATKNVYQDTPKGVPGIDKNVPCTTTGKNFGLKIETVAYRKDLFIVKSTGAPTQTRTTVNNTNVKTNPTTTPYSEKWDNGKIKVQGQKNKEGEQEGTWKYFDENGKLERIENYIKGVAEGEWKYYEEGKLTKTEIYKGGEVISTKEEEN